MPDRNERWFLGIVLIAVLSSAVLPYLYASRAGGSDYIFGGFLLNPLDGNTYLAKMELGWRGEWRYHLLYSAETSPGAYLFLFYILLGHVARWLGFSNLLTFHLARILATVGMVWMLYRFLAATLPGRRFLRYALVLSVFGSGMGWLTLPFGGFTADFWVAEGYPFLSAFANPHFPLAIGLLSYLLMPVETKPIEPGKMRWLEIVGTICAALSLAIIAPFGLVIASLVLLVVAFTHGGENRRSYFWRLIWSGLAGGPYLAYTIWVTRSDAMLSIWNSQNITPTLPWWNMAIALSPALLLGFASVRSWNSNRLKPVWIACVWVVIAIILLYIPWNLQRRFALGIYVPLCILAAFTLASRRASTRWARFVATGALLLSLPTNIVILLSAQQAIANHDDMIFLSRNEVQALQWIDENAAQQAVILAAPEMGLLIPAHTGRKVVYGHPYETIYAQAREQAVLNFFRGMEDEDSLTAFQVSDYIFYGTRERALGTPRQVEALEIAYQNPEVVIYRHPH